VSDLIPATYTEYYGKKNVDMYLYFALGHKCLQPETKREWYKKKVVFIAGTDSHGKGEHEHNGGSTLLSEKLKEGWPGVET
jgi:hypothetical protein